MSLEGFSGHQEYGVGDGPCEIVAADFNGDGAVDLAVSNANQGATGSSVSILMGNGDGTFGAAVNYPVGWGPFSTEGADLDGDGDIDLTVANCNDRSISVLLGNGDGTFTAHQTYTFPSGSWGIIFEHTVADFDGDGDIDIAMIMLTPNLVVFMPNDGAGTFASPRVVDNVPGYPVDLEAGDFDGDGDSDIIVLYGPQLFVGNTVRVLENDGNATFGSPQSSAVGGTDLIRPPADFNGDGILDIAVNRTANPGGYISVALGSGDRTFGPVTNYAVSYPTGITASDFDGDGNIDLAVTNASPFNTVSVMLGLGDGTFDAPQAFAVVGGPQGPVAADLDGDSWPDLVTADFSTDQVSVLINLAEFAAGDLNCDGVVNNSDIPAFVMALSDPENYALAYPVCDPLLGDVNGDSEFNNADIPAFVELLTGG